MQKVFRIRRFPLSTVPFTRKKPGASTPDKLPYSFYAHAQDYLTYLSQIFDPLVSLNLGMKIQRNENDLLIDTGLKGKFRFTIDDVKENLVLSSPQSGIIPYYFCPETFEWLSVRDNHDLRGMVTRDWLRLHSGCPQFD
jgi:hypothetical protein